MTSSAIAPDLSALARALAARLAENAAARDREGGTAKPERDAIRQSGLLRASIPKEFGGHGANWSELTKLVRVLASADS